MTLEMQVNETDIGAASHAVNGVDRKANFEGPSSPDSKQEVGALRHDPVNWNRG